MQHSMVTVCKMDIYVYRCRLFILLSKIREKLLNLFIKFCYRNSILYYTCKGGGIMYNQECINSSGYYTFQIAIPTFNNFDCLLDLGVSMSVYWSWGRGFDPWHFHNFKLWTRSGTWSTQPHGDSWFRSSRSD